MAEQEKTPLTHLFVEREPRVAARVLESLKPVDVAAFLNQTPARMAAGAVSEMIPWSAARCLEKMNREKSIALIRALPHSDAVSILRLIDEEVREKLLIGIIWRLDRAVVLLFKHDETTNRQTTSYMTLLQFDEYNITHQKG